MISSGFSGLDCNPYDIPVHENIEPLSWCQEPNQNMPIKGNDGSSYLYVAFVCVVKCVSIYRRNV